MLWKDLMNTIKFNNFENLLSNLIDEIEKGSTFLTFSSRAARRFIFLYRKAKILKNQKVWRSPSIITLNFFADLLFEEIVTDKRVLSYENSLLLWYQAVKSVFETSPDASFVDLALEYKRHYDFADKNKISFQKSENDLFETRNLVFKEFEELKTQNSFLSYSEELKEIQNAIQTKAISLPEKIIILESEDFSPIEKDFIRFLSENTEICEFTIDDSKIDLQNEVALYQDISSEVESALNQAIELWESGEKSIAICYFDDSYKKEIERVLLDFENSFENSYRYHFEENPKISEFVSFEILNKILSLSEGIKGDNLFEIVSIPFFKPKVSIGKEELIKLKLQEDASLSGFKKDFGFGDELDIFLNNEQKKISEIVASLKKILENHFSIKDDSPLSSSFKEISEILDFFDSEEPNIEMKPTEFQELFSSSVQNREISDGSSELCGIQVLSYKNCSYQNFDKLFILGANLSVLPKPIPTFPLFTGEEKNSCDSFKITYHNKKEENFLKKVIATNRDVFISRAKKEGETPFISSPFLKGKERETKWSKYDFTVNKFLLSENIFLPAKTEFTDKFKENEVFPLELPTSMKVTKEVMELFSCPFMFFANHYLSVKAPEEASILIETKSFGSFLHKLVGKIGEHIKNITTAEDIDTDDIKRKARELIEEENNLPELQKQSLSAFLFGKEGRKGFIEEFIDFEKKRIQEGWKIFEIEKEYSKQLDAFDNIEIKGRIDRIELNNNETKAKIIDFKTKSGEISNRDKFQLEMYKNFLINNIENVQEFECKIVKLLKLDEKETKQTTADNISEFWNRFKKSFDSVKSGNFEPDPYPTKKMPCDFCGFGLLCHIEKKRKDGQDQEISENE